MTPSFDDTVAYKHPSDPIKFSSAAIYNNQVDSQAKKMVSLSWDRMSFNHTGEYVRKGRGAKEVALESTFRCGLGCVHFWTNSPVAKFRVLACIGKKCIRGLKEFQGEIFL